MATSELQLPPDVKESIEELEEELAEGKVLLPPAGWGGVATAGSADSSPSIALLREGACKGTSIWEGCKHLIAGAGGDSKFPVMGVSVVELVVYLVPVENSRSFLNRLAHAFY